MAFHFLLFAFVFLLQFLPQDSLLLWRTAFSRNFGRLLSKQSNSQSSSRRLLTELQRKQSAQTASQADFQRVSRALLRENRTELFPQVVEDWLLYVNGSVNCESQCEDVLSTAAMLVNMSCSCGSLSLATRVARYCGAFDSTVERSINLKWKGAVLTSLAIGNAVNRRLSDSIRCLRLLCSMGLPNIVNSEQAFSLLRSATKSGTDKECLQMLDLLLQTGSVNETESLTLLTNRFMQTLTFVKGAVSMDSMPPGIVPEVAFLGRSNVGKSSLLNLVCRRKGLAYTSKTPGKTSEWNFFCALSRSRVQSGDPLSFHLVDLPGMGHANVGKTQRQHWLRLLHRYLRERKQLRVIFHLIDSRHGVLPVDEQCFSSILPDLPPSVGYVCVLTKLDKLSGVQSEEATKKMIAEQMRQRTGRDLPIVSTSSHTQRGCCQLWIYILSAVLGENWPT